MSQNNLCPFCGKIHPPEASFCPNTGRAIPQSWFCAQCGKPVESEWNVCVYCGKVLDEPEVSTESENAINFTPEKEQGKPSIAATRNFRERSTAEHPVRKSGLGAPILAALALLFVVFLLMAVAEMQPQLPKVKSVIFTPTDGATSRVNATETASISLPAEDPTLLPEPAGPPKWEVLDSGIQESLRDIFFIDQVFGWVISDNKILLTINGGSTWIEQSATWGGLRSITFIDRKIGFVAAGNYFTNGTSLGLVLKTNDGGVNWRVVLQTEHALNSVSFVDEMFGGAVGEDYLEAGGVENGSTVIMMTGDGGDNWTTLDVSNQAQGLKDIYFFDRKDGWTVGQDGSILATDDGGKIWHTQSSGTQAWLYSVYFIDRQNGWIAGHCFKEYCGQEYGVVLNTVDGGTTWNAQSIDAKNLRSIHFTNPLEGWVSGAGSLYHTANSGVSWEQVPSIISSYWLDSIYFIDETHGWASGEEGLIIKYAPSD